MDGATTSVSDAIDASPAAAAALPIIADADAAAVVVIPSYDDGVSVPTAPLPPGMCPVKPQYIRKSAPPPRTSLDVLGKTRGMNKGNEREHTEAVKGELRPTFEGEMNFLNGDVLVRVKNAIRTATTWKRPRADDAPGNAPQATSTAAAEETSSASPIPEPSATQVQQESTGVSSDGATEGSSEQNSLRPSSLVEQLEAPQASPSGASSAEEVAAAARAARKAAAALEQESITTPPDVLRANSAKRDTMFRNKQLLAPLTTVGNLPFRRICANYGADITLGEMALVYNLNHTQKSEWSLLRRHESESCFGLQIAVSRPNDAVIFAKALAASDFSYDYIDINCGCPVDKLVQSGCGCGLWERKGRLREVVQNLTKYQSKPVTIKCRIGPDEDQPQLHKQIHEYEGWGASAVTIHGRSRKQRYTKLANWSYIEQCAHLTQLPVIGNGDIFSYDDVVQHRLEQPSVSSYMSGRGALIKPWLFEEIREGKTMDISSHERFEILKTFVRYGLAHWGADEKGVLATRRFLCEWLSFLCRYVPVGLLERLPQRMNERPPLYEGRDDMETLMASDSVASWIKISEMLLGPVGDKFKFTPKHKSNAYSTAGPTTTGGLSGGGAAADEDEG